MDAKDILEFKYLYCYEQMEAAVEKKELGAVLLGIGKCATSYMPIYTITDPYYVIVSFHILILEKRITNKEINDAFYSLEVNMKNRLLLLNYIEDYLMYRKQENVLDFDCKSLLKRIIANEDEWKGLDHYDGFILRINKLIEELGL